MQSLPNCNNFTNTICFYLLAIEFLMNNSGTPGMCPFLMDLTADASVEMRTRLPAATTLYGLIARAWAVEVRLFNHKAPVEARENLVIRHAVSLALFRFIIDLSNV